MYFFNKVVVCFFIISFTLTAMSQPNQIELSQPQKDEMIKKPKVTPLAQPDDSDNIKITQANLYAIRQALLMYRVHCHTYPTKVIGLKGLIEYPAKGCASWRGPYIDAKYLVDLWGTSVRYTIKDKSVFLQSAGPDKIFNTADDQKYP